jgi:hypothetical protein
LTVPGSEDIVVLDGELVEAPLAVAKGCELRHDGFRVLREFFVAGGG